MDDDNTGTVITMATIILFIVAVVLWDYFTKG
jgi:hypothetical protein